MSRSCQRATSWSPASRLERTTRASPLIVSAEIGLRLWGIADEPFWPALNPSSTSADLGPLEVAQLDGDELARRRDRRRSAYSSSAWRSRAMTWVAGTGRSPSRAPTYASTAGSTLEYVPTAPDSLHTATDSAGGGQPGAVAVELQRPQRDLGAERRRLGVDAVRAPDHHRVEVRAGHVDERRQQRVGRRQHEVGGVAHAPSTARCRRRRTTSGRSGSTSRPARRWRPGRRRRTRRRRGRSCARARARRRRTRRRRPAPARGTPRRRRPARRRARRGPRWPAARPPASARSASCRPRPPPSPGWCTGRSSARHDCQST